MKNENKNQEALTEAQLAEISGGRALGQAPAGSLENAPDQGAGNLSGDIHPEPDLGRLQQAPKRLD